MVRRTCSGILVLLGLLAMVSIEPGEALCPYITVMAAALAAVISGAKLGGWWMPQKHHKKAPPGMTAPKRRKDKYTTV